jgi:hypothetical protein
MALPGDPRSDGAPAVSQGSTEISFVAEADRSRSVFGRALLALALLVGFYVLALAIVAALLGLLWVQVTMVNRTSVYLMMICIVVPIAIVVAIFPRSAKFPTPGIRLSPKAQPRLFKFLQEVAQSTGRVCLPKFTWR